MKKYILVLGACAIGILFFKCAQAVECPSGTTENVDCWSCGVDCKVYLSDIKDSNQNNVKINSTGENAKQLNVIGTGETEHYYNDADRPWFEYNSVVTSVSVGSQITSIGYNAFTRFPYLDNVSFETDANGHSSLESMASFAFGESNISHVVLPDSLTGMNWYVFCHSDGPLTESVVFPNSYQGSGEGIFNFKDNAKVYCPVGNEDACLTAIIKSGKTEAEANTMLKNYTKDTQTGFYQTEDGKLFANANLMAYGAACTDEQNCRDILAAVGQNASFKVGSKIYNSLEDFAKGNNVKYRIYTIDEANAVAKPTGNTVRIKYR